jgi:hypothetical protein
MSRAFLKIRRGPVRQAFFGAKSIVALGLLVVVLGVGYLAQIGSAAAKGDRIRLLEKEVAELKTEKEKIELEVAAEQSVRAVSKKVEGLGLVATTDLDYVTPSAPAVAKR